MSKVAHIGLIVKDVERSSLFYQQVCGCEPERTLQDERIKIQFLSADGVMIELLQYLTGDPEEHRRAGVVDHIAFQVDNIESAVEKLHAAGVKLLMKAPRQSIIGANIFFFEGPDGERVEFVQPLR